MAARALALTTSRHAIKNRRPSLLPSSAIIVIHQQSYRLNHHNYSTHPPSSRALKLPPSPHQARRKATTLAASMSASSTNDLAKTLKALHKPGQPLIVSNVWDAPSLNAVASLNDGDSKPVRAFATASWALAHARGVADEDLTLEQNLAVLRELAPLAARVGLPLSADLQDGYGAQIDDVFSTAARYGVAGANLEDSIPSAGFGQGIAGSLYSKEDAVARIQRALKAAAAAGVPDFVVNARCDVFKLDAAPELDDETRMREALDRGRGYLAAGATTVFFWGGLARGLSTAEVKTLVKELDGKVAVLLTKRDGGHSTAELAEIGVARISIGPALYRAAMDAVKTGAAHMLGGGGLL